MRRRINVYIYFSFMGIDLFQSFLLFLDLRVSQIYLDALLKPINLILLMLIQSAILEKISTKNLLTVTVSQTQLQNNFELILKALKSHDSCISTLISKVNNLENSAKNNSERNSNKQRMKENDGSVDRLKHEQIMQKLVNKEQVNDEQIKNLTTGLNDMRERINNLENMSKQMSHKLNQHQSSIQRQEQNQQNFQEKIEKTQQRLDIIEEKLLSFDKYGDKISQLQKELKEQIKKILKIDQTMKQLDNIDKSNKGKDQKQSQSFNKERINQLLKQLQNKLTQKLTDYKTQTNDQFQKIYGMINDITKGQITKINQSLQDHAKKSKKLSEDIWRLNDQIYKQQSEQLKSSGDNIDPKRINELERKMEQLRQALSNLNSDHNHFGKNYSTAIKTPQKTQQPQWSPFPNRNYPQTERQQPKDLNKIKEQSSFQDKANFKKQIIDKLKQQKGDFNKALKKLDNINLKKQQEKQRLSSLQQKVLRIQHILDGKIDEQAMKKWMRYIENKINYLYRIVNVESPEQDACIARKNWICLSCDKKLDAYKGKVGSHLASAQLKGKTLEQDVVGGGMLFRSKSRYQMPTVKK